MTKRKMEAGCVLVAQGPYGPLQEYGILGVDEKEGVFFTSLRHYYVKDNGKPDGCGYNLEGSISMYCIKDAEPVPNTKTMWRMKKEYR